MRGRRSRRAIASASLLVAFSTSLLFILAIVLDWVNLRPAGYQLAGSSAPLSNKTQASPTIQPQQIKKSID
jgi:hypothetical protein